MYYFGTHFSTSGPSTVEERVVYVLLPDSPAFASAPSLGALAGSCPLGWEGRRVFPGGGRALLLTAILAVPSGAKSLKAFSFSSLFHRMRLTGEGRSMTSICPASSSTSTTVTRLGRQGLEETWASWQGAGGWAGSLSLSVI